MMAPIKKGYYFIVLTFWFIYSPFSFASSEQLTPYTVRQVQFAYDKQLEEKPDEAIKILESLKPSQKYDVAYVQRMLGGLYWQTKQTTKAVEALTLAFEAEILPIEKKIDTLRLLADILLIEGEYQFAESYYQKLVPLYREAKGLEWVWLRVAQAQYQQQKWALVEQSIDHQQRYLKEAHLEQKASPLKMKLGAQLALEKWQDALSTTLSLRALETDNFLWWRQLVTLYLYTKQPDQALITLQQADRFGFDLSEEHLKLLAQLYSQKGIPQKAAQTYARLTVLNSSAEGLAQQATYWQLAKEWEKAGASWRKAAMLDEKYYWQYTLLMLRLNDYDAALTSVNKVKKTTNEVMRAKVRVLSALGKKEEALDVATQWHQRSPSDESQQWIQYLTEY